MVSCLKQVKDLNFEFWISRSFFSEKILDSNTIILFSFPLDGCVDEVIDRRADFQEYRYFHFLEWHAFAGIHFMNGEGYC